MYDTNVYVRLKMNLMVAGKLYLIGATQERAQAHTQTQLHGYRQMW